MNRWGNNSKQAIADAIKKTVPENTKRCKKSVNNQFKQFCEARHYQLDAESNNQVMLYSLFEYNSSFDELSIICSVALNVSRGSLMVRLLASEADGPAFEPRWWQFSG